MKLQTSSTSIKILIFHPHFTIAGGAGNFVLETGSRLAEKGYKVIVLTISVDPEIVKSSSKKIEFIELGGPLSSSLSFWLALPLLLRKVLKICDKINPDVLFPQVFPANWWGFFCKFMRPNYKLLWMCQEPSAFIHSKIWIDAVTDRFMNFVLRRFNPLLKRIDIFLAQKADSVLVNSQYGKIYASQIYNYPEPKLKILYLGANPMFPLGTPPPSFDQRKLQFITICRLTRFKNVALVIKALADLKEMKCDNFENLELKIVGRGEEEEALKKQVLHLKLSDSVSFCGALSSEELVRELSNSRAFVLASVDEPFGLAIVEALACGTPAVVVNSGGPAEIVEDNRSGYHVRREEIVVGETHNLAKKIEVLLNNERQFTLMSKAAIERSKLFSWDKAAGNLELEIKRLIKQ